MGRENQADVLQAIQHKKYLDERITYRKFLIEQTMIESLDDIDNGSSMLWMVIEAVDSTALEHPEWDMSEVRRRGDWYERRNKKEN
jgi:hypothetical protein